MNNESRYNIVRMYFLGGKRIIAWDVSLEEAQAHCRDIETSSSTCTTAAGINLTRRMGPWFDGYDELR